MTYLIGWGRDDSQPTGQHETAINTVDELDAVLDRIEQAGIPQLVDISPADDEHDVPYGLQIGIGPVERSFAVYIGDPAGGAGYDPQLPPAATSIRFDSGGEPTDYSPDQLRLTPDQVRQVAREYVHTGHRPSSISWAP
jgi:hypothetical protein